jgi:hypothetical protein
MRTDTDIKNIYFPEPKTEAERELEIIYKKYEKMYNHPDHIKRLEDFWNNIFPYLDLSKD